MKEITEKDRASFLNDKLMKTKSLDQVYTIMNVLSMFMEFAEIKGWIEENPWKDKEDEEEEEDEE